MKTKSIFFIMIAGAVFVACAKNKPADYYSDEQSEEIIETEQYKPADYYSDEQSEEIIETEQYKQQDNSSTKWKEFAGKTYRASQWVSDRMQYYAFSYNRSGKGKYFIYCNYPGTNVVEDQMEFSIYNVESEGNCLYLYSHELNSPVKIEIQGSSLYTMNGDRYEIWR